MSDTPKLTQAEAESLISMLKKTLVEECVFPEKSASLEFEVCGDTNKDLFTIRIYRGRINPLKYEISSRIKKDGILLLEFHVNPGKPHMNPDGEKITGSHWHIYSEEYGRRQAFPAGDISADDFVENTILFMNRFNIIEKPTIFYQTEII